MPLAATSARSPHPVSSWEQIPLTAHVCRSPEDNRGARLLGGAHQMFAGRVSEEFTMDNSMETVRLLVALLPLKVDEVPEFHEDFAAATVFVLVTIFDQFIEIGKC